MTTRSGLDVEKVRNESLEKAEAELARFCDEADARRLSESGRYKFIEQKVKAKRSRELTQCFKRQVARPATSSPKLGSASERTTPRNSQGSTSSQGARLSTGGRQKTPTVFTPEPRPNPEPVPKPEETAMATGGNDEPMTNAQLQAKVNELTTMLDACKVEMAAYTEDRNRWNNAMKVAAETAATAQALTTRVTQPRFHAPRLQAYTNDTDDFRMFLRRFKAYKETMNLDEAAEKLELIANLKSKITERIVQGRENDAWTVADLVKACKARLCPDWTVQQLENQLYKIETAKGDDPEAIMQKIENIVCKANPDIPTGTVKVLHRTHFMRLIHSHGPMHQYVIENSEDVTSPNDALAKAKQYAREKGPDNDFLKGLVAEVVQTGQVATNLFNVDKTVASQTTAQPTTSTTTTQAASVQAHVAEKRKPKNYDEVLYMEDEMETDEWVDMMAMFLKKGDVVSQDELITRLNDLERFRRDIQSAGNNRFTRPRFYDWQRSQGRNKRPRPWEEEAPRDNKSGNWGNNRGQQNDRRGSNNWKGKQWDKGNQQSQGFKPRRFTTKQIQIDGKLRQIIVSDSTPEATPPAQGAGQE